MKATTRAVQLSRAKPEWLPLHIAILRFFPTFAANPKAFAQEMFQLAARYNPDVVTVEVAPFILRHSFEGVALIVDATTGEIELSSDRDHSIFDGWHSDIRAQTNSFPRAFDAKMFLPQYLQAAERQHDLALSIITSQRRAFDFAVKSGAAELFGRWRDLKADFEAIEHDQWTRYRPSESEDWTGQTDLCLIAPNGILSREYIYSIHVQGHRHQASASNRAVQECEQFLLQRMQASPNERISESELEINARQFWSVKQLPKRKFQECYRRAKSQMKSEAWQKRGRLPNSIQCTG